MFSFAIVDRHASSTYHSDQYLEEEDFKWAACGGLQGEVRAWYSISKSFHFCTQTITCTTFHGPEDSNAFFCLSLSFLFILLSHCISI